VDGLSGTVVQNADLGLPSLPGVGGSGSSDLTSLVSGSHTLRLWYAGPNRARLAVLGTLGESDVVRDGRDLWIWSSATKSATHRRVPLAPAGAPRSFADASPMTPQQAADTALRAISPSTKVSTDGTAVVAGRSAYELLLTPRDSRSMIGSVRIAIDGKTHVPTRVQVYSRKGGAPAFEIGFTSFDPTTPSDSVFGFNPPPGTKVTESDDKQFSAPKLGVKAPNVGKPHAVGKGWTTVLVARMPDDGKPGPMRQLVKSLPAVSGDWGSGHLLRGKLFSAVVTDDGRVAIGAVAPEALYDALAG
jgi:outer membrane lipoprotein-sorting protein